MSVHKSAGFLFLAATLCAGSLGCHSGGEHVDDPSDDSVEHADDMEAAKALSTIPEDTDTQGQDKDMEYLKGIAEQAAKQALKCDTKGNKGPRDVATVDIKFEARGWSSDVVVHPPHEGTPIGNCMVRAFQKLPHSGFEGEPVMIKQEVDFAAGKKKE